MIPVATYEVILQHLGFTCCKDLRKGAININSALFSAGNNHNDNSTPSVKTLLLRYLGQLSLLL